MNGNFRRENLIQLCKRNNKRNLIEESALRKDIAVIYEPPFKEINSNINMNGLLNQIALISITSPSLSPQITAAAENYINGTRSVCIMTGDVVPFRSDFSLVIWNDWEEKQEQFVEAYVIDIRNQPLWRVDKLGTLKRTSQTKFVIIERVNQGDLRKAVQKYGLCNVLFITEDDSEARAEEANEECSGPGEMMEEEEGRKQCYMNASFMDLPPQNLFIDGRMFGWEGQQLQAVADHFRYKINWTNHHEIGWVELVNDAAEGRSLTAHGGIYSFHYRWVLADLIYGCSPILMTWAAPLHAGQSEATWFIILVSEMSITVWACVFFSYMLLVVLAGLFHDSQQKGSATYLPFHIIALTLGSSQKIILHRGFTLTIVFFGFMITLYYQAIMSSKLTAPAKPAEISTWKDMLESGLEIKGNVPLKKMIKERVDSDPTDPVKQKVYEKYIIESKSLSEMLLRVAQDRNMMYARHTTNILYVAEKDERIAGKIHLVEEPINKFFPATLMPKHSCKSAKFQRMYRRLCSSGLAFKWYKDNTATRPEEEDNGLKKLAIMHVKGFLYLLLLGWTLASFALILEISVVFLDRQQKKIIAFFNTTHTTVVDITKKH